MTNGKQYEYRPIHSADIWLSVDRGMHWNKKILLSSRATWLSHLQYTVWGLIFSSICSCDNVVKFAYLDSTSTVKLCLHIVYAERNYVQSGGYFTKGVWAQNWNRIALILIVAIQLISYVTTAQLLLHVQIRSVTRSSRLKYSERVFERFKLWNRKHLFAMNRWVLNLTYDSDMDVRQNWREWYSATI